MLGNLGNMMGMLKQVKEMQSKMEEIKAELANQRFDADAGAGAVTATVDGKGTLLSVKIDPASASDVELLEDLIKAAVNAAVEKSQNAMKEEMAKLTGGLDIPGLDGLFGQGS